MDKITKGICEQDVGAKPPLTPPKGEDWQGTRLT